MASTGRRVRKALPHKARATKVYLAGRHRDTLTTIADAYDFTSSGALRAILDDWVRMRAVLKRGEVLEPPVWELVDLESRASRDFYEEVLGNGT